MKYECDKCGRDVGRANLLVKRTSFHEMGRGGKMIRQRVVAWLCRDRCLGEDPIWNKQPFATQEEQQAKKPTDKEDAIA